MLLLLLLSLLMSQVYPGDSLRESLCIYIEREGNPAHVKHVLSCKKTQCHHIHPHLSLFYRHFWLAEPHIFVGFSSFKIWVF